MINVKTPEALQLKPVGSASAPKAGSPQGTQQENNLAQLSKALLGVNESFVAGVQSHYQERQKAELARKDLYSNIIYRDNKTGSTKEAQEKGIIPNLLASTAMVVDQDVGQQYAKTKAYEIISSISSDSALRTNDKARNEYIEQKQAELMDSIKDRGEMLQG